MYYFSPLLTFFPLTGLNNYSSEEQYDNGKKTLPEYL